MLFKAGGSESKATADATASLQNAFDEFVQFYLENADRKINLLKQEEVQNLLRLLSGVKGTVCFSLSIS